MSYAGQVEVDSGVTSPVASTLYGICNTAAATAAKIVALPDYDELITGTTVHVKFTNSNTAASPTLAVGSTAAKPIYKYGTTAPGTTEAVSWAANSLVSLTYDGTAWRMNDSGAESAIVQKAETELAAAETAMRAQIAPAYDATATYKLGALVFHDGVLYRCIYAIETAEAWDSTHWSQTTVEAESLPRIGSISMPAASWAGDGPWTQTVTVSGATVTGNSMVSLQPDSTVFTRMATDGTAAIFVTNNAGTLTATAIQKKPTADITVQCTVTETI